MAALQTIRSKGSLLLIIIGIGLFAFIAEEFVRSIQTTANEKRQLAGSVCGNKINSQEFQQMVEQYKDALKFLRGETHFNDFESAQAEDYVWQSYVNYQLISKECDKLGLTVTDKELQDFLVDGTSPMLQQTPFVNQQKRFDVAMLKNFLTEYEKMQTNTSQVPQQYLEQYTAIYKYWKFVEKTLRENMLEQKFQILLAASILSNPVEAKMYYEDNTKNSDILLAAFPYRNVKDDAIKVTDADLKAKYEETKEKYRQYVESRDIRFVAFTVEASEKDKQALNEEMDKFAQKMAETKDLTGLVRMSNSQVLYNNLWITKNALPADIQGKLDSISVGEMKGPYYEASDNTNNIIKLIAKTQAPDSIECRMIQVGGATLEATRKSADSIYTALKNGASFDSVAKKYNQNAAKQWLVSNQYENTATDENNTNLLNTLNTMALNEIKNIEFEQGNIIVEVTDRKAMTTKYNLAVIKRPVTFSKETYSKAYNKFSHYLATSTTMEALEKNAPKNGYQYQANMETYSNGHFINNIPNTKEALRWVFNEDTKTGDISPLYECGDNNTLLVVALNKIHKEGYLPLEDVKSLVENEVKKDKRAEYLLKQYGNLKSIEEAGQKGAAIDTLKGITFNGNTFVPTVGSTDLAINGSIANKKANQFVGPVKGGAAVYYYKVLDVKQDKAVPYKETDQMNMARSQHMRNLQTFGNDLFIKGKVIDKRYLFF